MKREMNGQFATLYLTEQEIEEYNYAITNLTNNMSEAVTEEQIQNAVKHADSLLNFVDLVWEKVNNVVVLVSEGAIVTQLGREDTMKVAVDI